MIIWEASSLQIQIDIKRRESHRNDTLYGQLDRKAIFCKRFLWNLDVLFVREMIFTKSKQKSPKNYFFKFTVLSVANAR